LTIELEGGRQKRRRSGQKEDEVKRGGRGSDHEHDGAVILLNVPGSEKFY
jgi:hypothetical protein